MQELSPITPSKKKQALAISEDILRGFATLVPPLFVAGLLFGVPLEKFQGHEKTAIYSLLLLAGIFKAAIENYKREHPGMARTYDYPEHVKIADHGFATADGFASFVIPFLYLGVQDELHPTVQLFHLPILISSIVYAVLTLARSLDKSTIAQSLAEERHSLLRRQRHNIPQEGFIADVRCLIDYLNNAIFPAVFQIAPIAFALHDFFNVYTTPVLIGLSLAILVIALARFAVYYFQRSNPDVTPKDYPAWLKSIEILSNINNSFGLMEIPALVLNAFVPLNNGIKIGWTALSATYSAISTINKADDLGLPIYNPLAVQQDENMGCWQRAKNSATYCCSFFSSSKRHNRRLDTELLDNMEDSNLIREGSDNPLYSREDTQPENVGCWHTVKKAATSCMSSLFSSSSTARTESTESLLLASGRGSLNRKEYVQI